MTIIMIVNTSIDAIVLRPPQIAQKPELIATRTMARLRSMPNSAWSTRPPPYSIGPRKPKMFTTRVTKAK